MCCLQWLVYNSVHRSSNLIGLCGVLNCSVMYIELIIFGPWQTMRFGITLVVRTMPGKHASKFSFQLVPALDRHGVDVSRNDIL